MKLLKGYSSFVQSRPNALLKPNGIFVASTYTKPPSRTKDQYVNAAKDKKKVDEEIYATAEEEANKKFEKGMEWVGIKLQEGEIKKIYVVLLW